MNWRDQAKCFEHVMIKKRDDYWHNKVNRWNKGDMTAAKHICWGCPVKTDCLTHALDKNEPIGVWGGFTPRERRDLKRALEQIDAEELAG